MPGFWSGETLKQRLPELIDPYESIRVESCSYELSLGDESMGDRLGWEGG